MILILSEPAFRYLYYLVNREFDDVKRKLDKELHRKDSRWYSEDKVLDLEAELKLLGDLHDIFLYLRIYQGFDLRK